MSEKERKQLEEIVEDIKKLDPQEAIHFQARMEGRAEERRKMESRLAAAAERIGVDPEELKNAMTEEATGLAGSR